MFKPILNQSQWPSFSSARRHVKIMVASVCQTHLNVTNWNLHEESATTVVPVITTVAAVYDEWIMKTCMCSLEWSVIK